MCEPAKVNPPKIQAVIKKKYFISSNTARSILVIKAVDSNALE